MLLIDRMQSKHLDQIVEIENTSFIVPWSRKSFEDELKNDLAIYYVALAGDDKRVVAYGGMWHIVNEGHITNIAVLESERGKGVGKAILTKLLDTAKEREMIGVTLEVSINNERAQRLYTQMGFKIEGIRKNYYEVTNESAVIMWKWLPLEKEQYESDNEVTI